MAFPADPSKLLRPGMAAPFSWLPKLSRPGRPAGKDDADGAGDDVWRILLGPSGMLNLFTGNCPASILRALNRGHHET